MYDKKPQTYEEAKIFMQEAIDNDHEKHKLKVAKLKAMFAAGIGISAAVTAGVITQDPTLSALSFAAAIMVTSPVTLQYFIRKRVSDKIHSGEYFNSRSEQEIITLANQYIDAYNDLESKGKIK